MWILCKTAGAGVSCSFNLVVIVGSWREAIDYAHIFECACVTRIRPCSLYVSRTRVRACMCVCMREQLTLYCKCSTTDNSDLVRSALQGDYSWGSR